MTTAENTDNRDFAAVFELGYFIHANREVAFFIAEDALDELPLIMGKQQANRTSSRLLSGFWKGGERARPIRQTIRLTERQMLQWLCYKQSEYWERQTEQGDGLYTPTEEDMIVRYLAYLIFSTLRRGSFYVSLAIVQVLHQLDRRETRLFYDVLTQSDSARMKDTGYIGKQRLELLKKVCQRFEGIIRTTKINGGEKQIVAHKPTPPVADLVRESLRRLTPWDTGCLIESRFEVTDIPDLYSSGSDSDEDRIEMNRIHTVVDPECFTRFVEGLCGYARSLPAYSPDKDCNFDLLDDRLAVPEFASYTNGQSRGDRFQVPSLAAVDYIRLRRTLETRARRRRSFNPSHISVFVDSSRVYSFELSATNCCEFSVGPDVGLIEVRGADEHGELLLATLPFDLNEFPPESVFKDTIVDQGGQRVELELNPIRDGEGKVTGAKGQVTYVQPGLKTFFSKLFSRDYDGSLKFRFATFAIAGVALLLVLLTVLWFQIRSSEPVKAIQTENQTDTQPSQERTEKETSEEPAASPKPPDSDQKLQKETLIARASWSRDPKTALRAILIEPTRSESATVDLLRRQSRLLLSLPLFDGDRPYTRFRVILVGNGVRYWQETLAAPKVSLTGSAHILDLILFQKGLTRGLVYDVQVEGFAGTRWESLGHVLLSAPGR